MYLMCLCAYVLMCVCVYVPKVCNVIPKGYVFFLYAYINIFQIIYEVLKFGTHCRTAGTLCFP